MKYFYAVHVQHPGKESLWIGTYEATPETARAEGIEFARLYWPTPFVVLEYSRTSNGGFICIPPPTAVNYEVTE